MTSSATVPVSIAFCRTMLERWKRYNNDPDPRIRRRFTWEVRSLRGFCSPLLWVIGQRLKKSSEEICEQMHRLRQDIGREFGLFPCLATLLASPLLFWTTVRKNAVWPVA